MGTEEPERDVHVLRESSSFSPGVVVDGRTVYPPGWLWQLSFAMAGCKWAIKACETNDWKNRTRQWFKDQDRVKLEQQIERTEKELERLKAELCQLKTNSEPSV